MLPRYASNDRIFHDEDERGEERTLHSRIMCIATFSASLVGQLIVAEAL
jgi:hypothetical protein